MSGLPWMKFYGEKWLGDADLSRCSLSTKGVWIDLCAFMQAKGIGTISGTLESLAKIPRCSAEEIAAALAELKVFEVADVTDEGGTFSVTSRRLSRMCHAQVTERNKWKERKKRQRAKNVTPMSRETPAVDLRRVEVKTKNRTEETALKAPGNEPSKRGAAEKPKREETPTYQVVKAWQDGWVLRFKPADGRPPEANDADWKQAKNLLQRHALEEALAYVIRFLDDTDKFVAERGHLLRDLPSRIPRYKKTAVSVRQTGFAEPVSAYAITQERKL